MPFGAMGLVLVPFLELREAPMGRGWGCEVLLLHGVLDSPLWEFRG